MMLFASIKKIKKNCRPFANNDNTIARALYVYLANKGIIESTRDDEQFGGMIIIWRAMTIMVRALYAYLADEANADESMPLIHACIGIGDHCSSSFLDFLLSLDPNQALQRDARGNLPLHIAAAWSQFLSPDRKAISIEKLVRLYMKGPSCLNYACQLPITADIIHDKKYGPWVEPLLNIGIRLPDWAQVFLCAASCESMSSLDLTYHVLRANAATVLTRK